jgi:hypothetical protein
MLFAVSPYFAIIIQYTLPTVFAFTSFLPRISYQNQLLRGLAADVRDHANYGAATVIKLSRTCSRRMERLPSK